MLKALQMHYDPTVDALALMLRPGGQSARTVEVTPGVRVDFDARGRLVTLEVLDASWHADRAALEQLPTGDVFLTLAEAAGESGLAAATLRVQINRGQLPGTKRGRDWLVSRTDLLNYLDQRDARGRPAASPRARRARERQRKAGKR